MPTRRLGGAREVARRLAMPPSVMGSCTRLRGPFLAQIVRARCDSRSELVEAAARWDALMDP